MITKGIDSDHQLLDWINITGTTFVKDVEDTKTYKHLFTINNLEGCKTFVADDSHQKIYLINQIQKLIEKKKQQNGINEIFVVVIGTEQRNIKELGTNHTVYKIDIKNQDCSQRIEVRYSEMVALENLIKKKYPNIKVPHLSTTNWLSYRKTKIIEGRKILIENFLQQILMNEASISETQFILDYLHLPPDFFQKVDSKGTPRQPQDAPRMLSMKVKKDIM